MGNASLREGNLITSAGHIEKATVEQRPEEPENHNDTWGGIQTEGEQMERPRVKVCLIS